MKFMQARSAISLTLLAITWLSAQESAKAKEGTSEKSEPFVWPELKAKAAILIDAESGQELFTKSPDERRQIASTQKLVTALIIERAGNLEKTAEYLDAYASYGARLPMKNGLKYPRKQLLGAMLVRSANDAALTLAHDHSGNAEKFAKKMNDFAEALGLKNSHFVSPAGQYDRAQYCTARDLSKIARAAYENKALRKWMQTEKMEFAHPDGTTVTLENTNKLLSQWELCTGIKTGYTRSAGYCLVASAEKEVGKGKPVALITVVLGCPTEQSRFEEAQKLLEAGFDFAANAFRD